MAMNESVPSTMKSIQASAYGDPSDTLQLNPSVPLPRISGASEVLLRVYSCSINPIDYKICKGYASLVYPQSFPYTPGWDVAGEVIAVGPHVHSFKSGDRVYGTLGASVGTMREYCIGSDYQLSHIPSSLTYSQAAAIPLVALTSYQGLFVHGGLKSGQRVLILGGSSATGQAAIQFAKAAGASVVVTTASTRNIDLVRGFGADEVIDYTKQKWEQVLKDQDKFDIVYDTVGEEQSWERGESLVKKDGIFLQISRVKHPIFTVGFLLNTGLTITGRTISSWFGGPRYKFFGIDPSIKGNGGQYLTTINKWIEEGKYRQPIEHVYPFSKEGAVQSLEEISKGKARGKFVMEIIPPTTPTPTINLSSEAASS